MFPYLVVVGGVIFILMLSLNFCKVHQRLVAFFCIMTLTLFSAVRGFNGTDTYSYHLMFSDNLSTPLLEMIKNVEPLFAFILILISIITDNSFAFIAFISLIQGLIVVKLIKTSKQPILFLILYVSVFYFDFEFNILRAGTAILLLVLATRYIDCQERMAFYICCVAAVLMHYSVLFAIVPLIYLKEDGLQARIFLTAMALLAAFVVSKYLIDQSRMGIFIKYFETFERGQVFQFGLGFFAIQALYIIYGMSFIRKDKLFIPAFFLLVWVAMMWAGIYFSYVDRIGVVASAVFLFLGLEDELSSEKKTMRIIALAGISCLALFGNLANMESISMATELDPSYAFSPYVPYKFFWEEGY